MTDEIEAHRKAVTGHCYRMLGSATDDEDAAQETLIRAWKAMDRFDGRSTLPSATCAAGATHAMDTQDHGFMYCGSFYDLDGHHWEFFWMDPAAMQ